MLASLPVVARHPLAYLFTVCAQPFANTLATDPGDVYQLTYVGSFCTHRGLVVSDISFAYHMWGDPAVSTSGMGTLEVVALPGAAIAFNASGNQGKGWKRGHASLGSRSFAFRAIRGQWWNSYCGGECWQ